MNVIAIIPARMGSSRFPGKPLARIHHNAESFPGNSGGALWAYSKKRDRYEMIGVPSMVGAYGWGTVIPHIAWSRPISEIRSFLRENDFGFVLGDEDVPKKDPDEEEKEK